MSNFPPLRDELKGLQPYGAPQLDVPVQLNVNENPYGPSPECVADIAASVAEAAGTLNRYPDREFTELRDRAGGLPLEGHPAATGTASPPSRCGPRTAPTR